MVMVDAAQIWSWLDEVPDPEVPAVSVVDLGIVRAVEPTSDGWVVSVTPTYSGCPAIQIIQQDILGALRRHGLERVHIQTRLAPAWTTDWLSPKGREALRQTGIAPPLVQPELVQLETGVCCPRCGSNATERLSHFGSTPCKALYRCRGCLDPFDYFKPHASGPGGDATQGPASEP